MPEVHFKKTVEQQMRAQHLVAKLAATPNRPFSMPYKYIDSEDREYHNAIRTSLQNNTPLTFVLQEEREEQEEREREQREHTSRFTPLSSIQTRKSSSSICNVMSVNNIVQYNASFHWTEELTIKGMLFKPLRVSFYIPFLSQGMYMYPSICYDLSYLMAVAFSKHRLANPSVLTTHRFKDGGTSTQIFYNLHSNSKSEPLT
jgi:hypothetical protein